MELASNAVVHLAARSNDRLGDLNPDWTYEINITATVSLARAAKQAGALFELTGHGFVPVSMRNATAWNASPRLRLDIVLNNLVGWAHTTGAIRLQSDGTSWGPLVHLRDIAGYAQALLDAPADAVAGEAFNVGSREQNYQVRELAELVNRALSACQLSRLSHG